ncbi:MAG: phospholipase D-like domain-containing protein [Nitrospira sp.]|nr:phospholipase D-like domain-containing protein [Nitrospira sp.]
MNGRPASSLNRNRCVLAVCLLWVLHGALDGQAAGATIEIYYAPEEAPLDRVVSLYDQARRYIYVSVYGFTSPRAAEGLVAARKRGVDVRLITDQERALDVKQRRALRILRLAGIPIRVNRHDGLMHLKQVVIDDAVNTSGSMNHTTSGNRYNDERLDVVTDHATTVKAREKFLAMWNDRERFEPWVEE